MINSIKAIETVYKGYRFRSRLEARWAVFFDTLGVRYEYEREGFELPDGIRYLPDFWLLDYRVWCEIKAERPSRNETEKHVWLAGLSDRPVIVTYGEVGPYVQSVFDTHKRSFDGMWQEQLAECPLCRSLGYIRYPYLTEPQLMPCLRGHGLPEHQQMIDLAIAKGFPYRCFNPDCKAGASCFVRQPAVANTPYGGPRIQAAMLAARQARFEHGESGAPK